MIRRPPRSTRTDTLFPYTTLFRSCRRRAFRLAACAGIRSVGRGGPRRAGLNTRRPTVPTVAAAPVDRRSPRRTVRRSEEHTSELQSLMRISYAVFCLTKKNEYYDVLVLTKNKYQHNNTHKPI